MRFLEIEAGHDTFGKAPVERSGIDVDGMIG
jgi:hypothetical protein